MKRHLLLLVLVLMTAGLNVGMDRKTLILDGVIQNTHNE